MTAINIILHSVYYLLKIREGIAHTVVSEMCQGSSMYYNDTVTGRRMSVLTTALAQSVSESQLDTSEQQSTDQSKIIEVNEDDYENVIPALSPSRNSTSISSLLPEAKDWFDIILIL